MSADIDPITMPKWGLSMTEGMVVEWHVGEGDALDRGDEILDIETTKITNALEAMAAGTLRRQVVAAGETVPVGALLGVVAATGVADADIDAFIEQFQADFAVQAAEAGPIEPEIVPVGEHRVNYLRLGEGEATPVVLVHGFGGDINNWLFNQPALAENGPVYALDLPGHGRSSKAVGAGDVAFLSGVVAGFLDAAGLERAHLAGHSLGGAVVLALALSSPDSVASLTLIAPAGLGPEINMDFIDGFIAAGRRKEMKAVLQMLFADPSLVSRDMIEDVLKYKRLDGANDALRTIAAAVFADGRQSVVPADRLGELTMPVRVAWGAEDRILPAAHARSVPDGIAVEIFDGVGHMAHMEAAGDVNTLLAKVTGG